MPNLSTRLVPIPQFALIPRLVLIPFLLFLTKATLAADTAYAIKEANIKVSIPNSNWHLQPKQERNGFVIYVFKRDPIQDSAGRNIIPNAAIVIEKVDAKMDIVTYSVNKRASGAFHVDQMFFPDDGLISLANAVSYKGSYVDKYQMNHTVYVVHAINGDNGIQIILDATTETFPLVDAEFRQILKSFRK